MKKMKDAWTLVSLSLRIIRTNPFLLAYLAAAVLAVSVLLGSAAFPVVRNWKNNVPQSLEPYASIDFAMLKSSGQSSKGRFAAIHPHWKIVALTALAVQLPGTFALLFFNVALLASVRKILNGQPASFASGIGLAWERRLPILQWALFSSTIGAAISLLQAKTDHWLVRRLIGAMGLAWTCATYLVVPVVAVEGCTPAQALRRSAELFRRTWGESFAATIGIETVENLAWLALGVIPGLALIYWSFQDAVHEVRPFYTGYLMGLGTAMIVLSFVAVKMAGEVAKMVFRMSLYVFATEGVIPEEYRDENCAWFVAKR